MNKEIKQKGFALVEMVIGTALISASLFGILSVTRNFIELSRETQRSVQASFLMEEGVEAVRSMRDRSFSSEISTLNEGTNYYLYFSTSTNGWHSTTTEILVDNFFIRSFTIEDVLRDANDDISESGSLDNGTKKVNMEVVWINLRNSTSTRSAGTYVTDYFEN